MKLGLISDIHSNKPALLAVLGALNGVDKVLCIGDLTGYYTDPNGVITSLLDHEVTFIIGNHDWYLDNPPDKPNSLLRQSIEFTRSVINPQYRQLLSGTPSQFQFEADGVRISLYHGSPWDTLEQYIYATYPHFERFTSIDTDVIILGHTHHPMIHRIKDKLLVNPGGCGQPRDNDWRASCAILDTQTLDVQIIRVDYDVECVVHSVCACGLDVRFANMLLRYRPTGIDHCDNKR